MTTYICTDGNAEIKIEADSARDAAQEYVDGGDWGEITETTWIHVYVTAEGEGEDERERVTITLDPEPPTCAGADHDWVSPHWLLGGLRENPGVTGHGGGVICIEACRHCGARQTTDTWAQDRETGEQGLRSVSYEAEVYAEEFRARGKDGARGADMGEVDLSDKGLLYREGAVGEWERLGLVVTALRDGVYGVVPVAESEDEAAQE